MVATMNNRLDMNKLLDSEMTQRVIEDDLYLTPVEFCRIYFDFKALRPYTSKLYKYASIIHLKQSHRNAIIMTVAQDFSILKIVCEFKRSEIGFALNFLKNIAICRSSINSLNEADYNIPNIYITQKKLKGEAYSKYASKLKVFFLSNSSAVVIDKSSGECEFMFNFQNGLNVDEKWINTLFLYKKTKNDDFIEFLSVGGDDIGIEC